MVFASRVPKECLIEGCSSPAVCRGLCRSHYNRQYYSGRPVKPVKVRPCLACGKLFELDRVSRKFCSPTCRKRWQRECEASRWKRDGSPLPIVEHERPRPEKAATELSYDSFTVDDVWAQSDGVCVVCGEPVSRDVFSDDAGTPAWIVSPDDGGERSLANRGIFHYRCLNRHGSTGSGRNARHARKAGGRSGGKRKKSAKT